MTRSAAAGVSRVAIMRHRLTALDGDYLDVPLATTRTTIYWPAFTVLTSQQNTRDRSALVMRRRQRLPDYIPRYR